jgi:hypothetical protein
MQAAPRRQTGQTLLLLLLLSAAKIPAGDLGVQSGGPPHGGAFCSQPCASVDANCSASVLPGRCTVCLPADARDRRYCGDCASGSGCVDDSQCVEGECFRCIGGACAVAPAGNCTQSDHWSTTSASLELPLMKCPKQHPIEQWYEAPETWVHAGKVWLMYSRCTTGPDYELMLAFCDLEDDVMASASTRHFSTEPVIVGDDAGPGHNGWFASPDGVENWLVYHGTAVNESGRSSRAMRTPFNSSGWPVISQPPPITHKLPQPSSSSVPVERNVDATIDTPLKTDDVEPAGARRMPWRGWTLLNAVGGPGAVNWSATAGYIRDVVLPAARAHNVTHLQLSQQLSWNAEDFDDPAARAAVAQIARDCRAAGVHSSVWTHELSQCPPANLRAGKCVLDDALWGWVAAKYTTLWRRVPEVDGVVLTISETAFDVTCEAGCKVVSNLSVPQRLVKLVRTVMAASPGKTVVMRAFVHTHANLDLMLVALHALADLAPLSNGAKLVVMAKAPPCDWHPFFPFNPLWDQWSGAAAALVGKGVRLVMEVDVGLEMLGQNQFVAPMVEPVGEMVRQARLLGAAGVSARIERSCLASEVSTVGSCRRLASGGIQPNTQVLGSWNEVSLSALTAYMLDANATVPEVWQQWGRRAGFGHPAAPAFAERVLGPVYDAVARAYFPLQQWTTQHSNIALWKVTNNDLTSYVVTDQWVPSPSLAIANRKLLHPRPSDILDLIDDQAIPANVLRRSLHALGDAQAAGALPLVAVEDLRSKLQFTAMGVAVLRAVHLTAFGIQCLLGLKAAEHSKISGALPGDNQVVHGIVTDAMATLRNASKESYQWPIDQLNIDNFLKDATNRLGSLQPPVAPAGYRYAGEGACRDAAGHYPSWGETRGVLSLSECAKKCSAPGAAPGDSCEAFMISQGGCQFFCGTECPLCPHQGNGGGHPTKGDGTAGQHCMVKQQDASSLKISKLEPPAFGWNSRNLGVGVDRLGPALKADDEAAARRRAVWWVTKGRGPALGLTDLEFVRKNRHAITGIAPCCGCWSIDANGSLFTDMDCHHSVVDGTARGTMEFLPQGWPTLDAVLRGEYVDAITALAAHARQQNWSGVHTDLEPMGRTTALPERMAYARFVANLSVAFEAAGLKVYVDAGTGTLSEFAALPGSPRLMTMGTYWNHLNSTSNNSFTRTTLHKLSSGLAPASCSRASVGIGVMLDDASEQRARQQYRWERSSLRTMLRLVGDAGLCEVAVYTNPMDNQGVNGSGGLHPSWSEHTASWFIAEIATFLAGGGPGVPALKTDAPVARTDGGGGSAARGPPPARCSCQPASLCEPLSSAPPRRHLFAFGFPAAELHNRSAWPDEGRAVTLHRRFLSLGILHMAENIARLKRSIVAVRPSSRPGAPGIGHASRRSG